MPANPVSIAHHQNPQGGRCNHAGHQGMGLGGTVGSHGHQTRILGGDKQARSHQTAAQQRQGAGAALLPPRALIHHRGQDRNGGATLLAIVRGNLGQIEGGEVGSRLGAMAVPHHKIFPKLPFGLFAPGSTTINAYPRHPRDVQLAQTVGQGRSHPLALGAGGSIGHQVEQVSPAAGLHPDPPGCQPGV